MLYFQKNELKFLLITSAVLCVQMAFVPIANAATYTCETGANDNGIKCGADIESSGSYSISYGYDSKALGIESTTVGVHNTAASTSSTAVGSYNYAGGTGSATAMGSAANPSGDATLVVTSNGDTIDSINGIAVTTTTNIESELSSTTITEINGVNVQSDTRVKANLDQFLDTLKYGGNIAVGVSSTALGSSNISTGAYSTAVGYLNTVTGDNSGAFGSSNTASGTDSTAVGSVNTATGSASTAVGSVNTAIGTSSTAVGSSNYAGGASATAMGSAATPDGVVDDLVVTYGGDEGTIDSINGIAVTTTTDSIDDLEAGTASLTIDEDEGALTADQLEQFLASLAAGGNVALGVSSTALGSSNISTGDNSTAVGYDNTVTGDSSGAFGRGNTVSGVGSYVVGSGNTVTENNSFVIGSDVTDVAENSVVLGAGSSSDGRDNTVSVGSDGKERQIINVEAGTDDNDAVNVGQLNDSVSSVATIIGDGVTVQDDGTLTGSITIGTKQYDTVTKAIAGESAAAKTEVKGDDDNIKVTSSVESDGHTVYIVTTDNDVTFDIVTVGKDDKQIVIDGDAGSITAGQVSINGTAGSITVGMDENQIVIDGAEGTVSGLSNTTWDATDISSGQAATEDQLLLATQQANEYTDQQISALTGDSVVEQGSVVLGGGNMTTTADSTAVGSANTATGTASTAVGSSNYAGGASATAMGSAATPDGVVDDLVVTIDDDGYIDSINGIAVTTSVQNPDELTAETLLTVEDENLTYAEKEKFLASLAAGGNVALGVSSTALGSSNISTGAYKYGCRLLQHRNRGECWGIW